MTKATTKATTPKPPPPPAGLQITLPTVRGITPGYCSRRVDVTATPAQAKILSRIQRALARDGVTLANGRPIAGNGGVIRWILEQLEKDLEGR